MAHLLTSLFGFVFFWVPAGTIRIAHRKSYENISEEECNTLVGPKDKTCPGITQWHETINLESGIVEMMCEPILAWTAKSTCTAWCQKAGYDCLRGQDQKDKTCTLDPKHTRKSTANNGCEQSWTNQICQCGKKHTESAVVPDSRVGGVVDELASSDDDDLLEEVDDATEIRTKKVAPVEKKPTTIIPYSPVSFPPIIKQDTNSSSTSTSSNNSTWADEDEDADSVAAPDFRMGELDDEPVSSDDDENLEEIDTNEEVSDGATEVMDETEPESDEGGEEDISVDTSETEPPSSEDSVEIGVGEDEFLALKRSERWARVEDIEFKLVEPLKTKIAALWNDIRAENHTLNEESQMIKELQEKHDRKRKEYFKRVSSVQKEYRKLQELKKKVNELKKLAHY